MMGRYQLKSMAELVESGRLFQRISKQVKQMFEGLPEPPYAVKITVEVVFDQSTGPELDPSSSLRSGFVYGFCRLAMRPAKPNVFKTPGLASSTAIGS